MLGGRCCRSAPSLALPSPTKYIRWSTSHCLSLQTYSFRPSKRHGLRMVNARPRSQLRPTLALVTQFSLQDLSHNQVLVAVLTASLIGQSFKPVTAALQGKGFNWRLLFASGGMPSSHSACVTAACTAIALERGLADPLFGLSVVFAGIVMYDAQGVRRAVGKQAEVINTIVVGTDPKARTNAFNQYVPANQQAELTSAEALRTRGSSSNQRRNSTMAIITDDKPWSENSPINIELAKEGSLQRSPNFMETAKKLPSVEAGDVNLQEIGDLDGWRHIPLKESVGHTKLEVLVGGLWGIFCTLAVSYFTDVALSQTVHL